MQIKCIAKQFKSDFYRKKKAFYGFVLMICLAIILNGCRVSDEDRKELFDEVIDIGDFQLEAGVNDYEELKRVSNAPVPGVSEYYIYRGNNGEKYTFEYQSTGSKEHPYRVKVNAEYEDTVSGDNNEDGIAPCDKVISYKYTFEKTRLFRRMKLIDSCVESYQLRFDEKDRYALAGLSSFYIYNGTVCMYFDREFVDERIAKYISDYKTAINKDIDIRVGTDQGTYNAGKITTVSDGGTKNYIIRADISLEGTPEWISVGNVKIDLHNC